MIRTESLTKTYGDTTALDGIDLDVREGELFVLLGPNGAGKTTCLKVLTTLLRPTSGSATVAGYCVLTEPESVKANVGYVPDMPVLYDRLTGREFLEFIADIRCIPKRGTITRLLDVFEIGAAADSLVRTYSLGTRKKIALAAALLHRPRVLFLDEPTGGLDPRSARFMKELLPRLCKDGMTVFMTTHILEIAEKMCDRVGVLAEGRMQACGTIEELRAQHGDLSLEDLFLKMTGARQDRFTENLWEPL